MGCGHHKLTIGKAQHYFNIPADSLIKIIGLDHNSRISDLDVLHDLNKYPYPFQDNSLDCIYASHILEHLANRQKAIKELWRILKPNGQLVVRVPHCTSVGASNSDHLTPWNSGAFNCNVNSEWYGAKGQYPPLQLNSIRLFNSLPDGKCPPPLPFRILSHVIDYFANINIGFTERWWAYWVGGFEEVVFWLRKKGEGSK